MEQFEYAEFDDGVYFFGFTPAALFLGKFGSKKLTLLV